MTLFENHLKNKAKFTLNTIWSLRRPKLQSRLIYYHSICDSLPGSHATADFYEQMRWLASQNVQCLTVDQFSSISRGQLAIGLSFDDGYSDNLDTAVPILQGFDHCATFFVATGFCGKNRRLLSDVSNKLYPDRRMMSQADLIQLSTLGFEVGSHTVSHAMLSRLDSDKIEHELRDSKRFLEDLLGHEVRSIAFPNGQKGAFSDAVVSKCFEVGYSNICSTLWGGRLSAHSKKAMARCEMSDLDTMADFKAKMLGQREYRWIIDRMMDKSQAW